MNISFDEVSIAAFAFIFGSATIAMLTVVMVGAL